MSWLDYRIASYGNTNATQAVPGDAPTNPSFLDWLESLKLTFTKTDQGTTITTGNLTYTTMPVQPPVTPASSIAVIILGVGFIILLVWAVRGKRG